MADIVYAAQTIHLIGRDILIVAGEPWDATDPLVRERPDLFTGTPPTIRTTRTDSGVVEQVTAAPGERRNVRRAGRNA